MKKYIIMLLGMLFIANIGFAATQTKAKNYIEFDKWYKQQYKKTVPFQAVAVFDYNTLKPIYYYQENKVIPSASLMKLVTAGTFIKYVKDWDELFSFSWDDNEGDLRPYVGPYDSFALLKLPYSDKITVAQIFGTMLIGSANNCANLLPKCIGYNKESFVKAMQTTLKEWGMTKTHVKEMSGLSLENTTTAHDIALAACHAFKNKEIAKYSGIAEFDYTTQEGTQKKIKHTVHDLRNNPTKYIGAKTGYLNETRYHVAAAYVTPKGRKICLAVLSTYSQADSEGMISKLAKWIDTYK